MSTTRPEAVGTLRLSRDRLHTTATVHFTRDVDGTAWTAEKVFGFLKDQGITQGIRDTEIRQALAAIADGVDSTASFVAARTKPPVPMEPETVDWVESPIPENLADAINAHLATLGPPVLVHEVHTVVKVTKQTLLRPRLPFFPPRKKEIEVDEEQVRTERISVDPRVHRLLWAEKGKSIGFFYPVKLGQPGQSLDGNSVDPPVLPDPHFHLGAHIQLAGGNLVAERTGFVRVGSNWAEIVQFRPHVWSLALGPDGTACYLKLEPGDQAIPAPDYSEIEAAAAELGFPPGNLRPRDELERMLKGQIRRGIGGELDISKTDDAFMDLAIGPDNMSATLTLRKHRLDGKPLDLEALGHLIRSSGVKILDKDVIRLDILNFMQSSESRLADYLLAEGKPPKKGPDEQVDWALRFFDEKDFLQARDKILGNRAALAGLESAASYPLDNLMDIAEVEKDSRVCTLGGSVPGNPGVDVFGNKVQGLPGKLFEYKLYEGLELRGHAIFATESGIFERAEVDGVCHMRVRPHKDADIELEVSDDGLLAWLSFRKQEGSGERMTMERIHAALEAWGIIRGILDSALAEIAMLIENNRECSRMIVARGQAPEDGGAVRIELLVQQASGKKVQIRRDGSAEYRNRDTITTVRAGEAVARLYPPPSLPSPGWDIRGKDIEPRNYKGQEFETGDNIRLESEEDGAQVAYATVDGQLVLQKNCLSVEAVYTVQGNVDAKTGNLKFPGAVSVTGDVESGFAVVCDGEVRIGGGVEAALVSSNADILIKGGVKGAGKGVLRGKANILAAFVENASVLAVGNAKILKHVLRSNVKCNGKLFIPEKGCVIGGTAKVKLGMDVGDLGSDRFIPTHVYFGQDYLIEDHLNVERKAILQIQQEIQSIDKALKLRAGQTDQVRALFARKTRLLKLLEKRNIRLFWLMEKFEQHFDAEIRVRGTVYPGVVLECHGRTLEISSERKGVIFSFDTASGRIVEQPIARESGQAQTGEQEKAVESAVPEA